MVERFLEQTTFASQEDFIKNLKIKVPENFNDKLFWLFNSFYKLFVKYFQFFYSFFK